MSREYIDNPAEDAAFSLRRIADGLEDLVAVQTIAVTVDMAHELAQDEKRRTLESAIEALRRMQDRRDAR